MHVVNTSAIGHFRITRALELIKRALPQERAWFDSVVGRIDSKDAKCGCDEKTVACTFAGADRKVVVGFHKEPGTMTIPDIAETLIHESRHWKPAVGRPGWLSQVPHRCSDLACSSALQRLADPIYWRDRQNRPKLEAVWTIVQYEIAFPALKPISPLRLQSLRAAASRAALEAM